MNYGRAPGRQRWHRITGDATLCRRGRGAGIIGGDWDLLDRLPPRHDQFCEICFPGHVPAPDQPAAVTPRWDLDSFIEGL